MNQEVMEATYERYDDDDYNLSMASVMEARSVGVGAWTIPPPIGEGYDMRGVALIHAKMDMKDEITREGSPRIYRFFVFMRFRGRLLV